jgi:hypothetical protein
MTQRVISVAACVLVAMGVALGFTLVGRPGHARAMGLDERRVFDLQRIAELVRAHRSDAFSAATDPETQAAYRYRRLAGGRFLLCATFATAARDADAYGSWSHPAGAACFRFFPGASSPDGPAVAVGGGAVTR